ncbi:sensor histidine kinase [Corynebacterium uterequi]|uniref:histidine kinase n=1 Tax=Corynebacterium uterequi TaxID=1072256 RepID=A0A0G3HB73_9CORY|nr:histidine kinase [Corynebacterium uterequi]AKK10569.1 signal transduction histidine kinase [Corynebacterium uterequi]
MRSTHIGAPMRIVMILLVAAATVPSLWHYRVLPDAVAAVVLGIIVAALVFFHRAPVVALVIVGTALSIQLVFPAGPEPVMLAPAACYAAYLAASATPRRLHPLWMCWLGAGAVGAAWHVEPHSFYFIAIASVAGAIILAFFWRLGTDALRQQNEKALLRERAELAAVLERTRIAREMHDIVAHALSGVIALADGARFAAADHPDVAAQALGTIATESRQALTQLRGLLTVLREEGSDDDASGRVRRAAPTLDALGTLLSEAEATGLTLSVTGLGDLLDAADDLPELTQLTCYRITQEMVTNMLRYAGGPDGSRRGNIHFAVDPKTITINAENPLAHRAPTTPGSGHGLIGMAERARTHGGSLRHHASADSFTVEVTIPR